MARPPRRGLARPHGVELAGGKVLLLPSNLPHSATVLEETIILDVFAPPSETQESTGVSSV